VTDAGGAPLIVETVAANQHDATTLLPLVVELPAVAGKPGRPKQKPAKLIADKLRLPTAAEPAPMARHRTGDSPARRFRIRTGQVPLVCRTHPQLAPSISPLTHPLGPSTRDTPSLLVPRRRRGLLPNLDQRKLVLSPGSKFIFQLPPMNLRLCDRIILTPSQFVWMNINWSDNDT
jgi:hypothetical protein